MKAFLLHFDFTSHENTQDFDVSPPLPPVLSLTYRFEKLGDVYSSRQHHLCTQMRSPCLLVHIGVWCRALPPNPSLGKLLASAVSRASPSKCDNMKIAMQRDFCNSEVNKRRKSSISISDTVPTTLLYSVSVAASCATYRKLPAQGSLGVSFFLPSYVCTSRHPRQKCQI